MDYKTGIKFFYLLISCVILIFAKRLQADSRTDYLVELLLRSGNYRVRIQAGKTLGQIGSSTQNEEEKKKIVSTLIKACEDRNELVRMTAAAMLGIIGETEAIPTLEKLKRDKVKEVREQAGDSIRKITSIQKQLAKNLSSHDSGVLSKSPDYKHISAKDTFLITIGTWSDRSGYSKYNTLEYAKTALIKQISLIPGVTAKASDQPDEKTKRLIKKKKVIQYTLTGSVGKITIGKDNTAKAEISVVVLDGEGNVTMMLKGRGKASLSGSRKSIAENEKELVLSALTTAVRGAVEPFSKQLMKTLEEMSKKSHKRRKKKSVRRRKK